MWVANQQRFLVFDADREPHHASHVLARIARSLSADHEDRYGHPVHLLKALVDSGRGSRGPAIGRWAVMTRECRRGAAGMGVPVDRVPAIGRSSVPCGGESDERRVRRRPVWQWRLQCIFRVLKSGCRVEFLAFGTADRLQRSIAINSVVAQRIIQLTLLGRQVPGCGDGLMYIDRELIFLHDHAVQYELAAPENLGDTVRLVAHPGGCRDRKHDPLPRKPDHVSRL